MYLFFRKIELNKLESKIRNVYNPLRELKHTLKRKDVDNIGMKNLSGNTIHNTYIVFYF